MNSVGGVIYSIQEENNNVVINVDPGQIQAFLGGRDPNSLTLTEREKALTNILMKN